MDDKLEKQNKKLSIILVLITIVVVSLMEFLMTLLCPSKNCFSPKNSITQKTIEENNTLEYKTYTNTKYGFSLEYPAFLTKKICSNDDNSITLKNETSTISLYAFGSNNTLNETPRLAFERNLKESRNVTYKYLIENYYIIAGSEENEAYCKYSVVGPKSINSFTLKYPKELEEDLTPVIDKIIVNFKSGDLYSNH
ncbi:hypothetical protein [Clostridium massiliamazoniense]|uniref:hypothetical protein n=1 Tax=Clostridium massiliamazoniense TaxID=1347366 RepID=UPI0006D85ECE|nr:hypothetical protein [Clostridium massiliamazoniense]